MMWIRLFVLGVFSQVTSSVNTLRPQHVLGDGDLEILPSLDINTDYIANPGSLQAEIVSPSLLEPFSRPQSEEMRGQKQEAKKVAKAGIITSAKSNNVYDYDIHDVLTTSNKTFAGQHTILKGSVSSRSGSKSQVSADSRFSEVAKSQRKNKNDADIVEKVDSEKFSDEFPTNIGSMSSDALKIPDCIGCLFIWSQVEMDCGNTQLDEVIYNSLIRNCLDAEETAIFWPTCRNMIAMSADMINGYVEGVDISEICSRNNVCRSAVHSNEESDTAATNTTTIEGTAFTKREKRKQK